MKKRVLHVVTVSFVINHFFGKQFLYLNHKNGNEYFLACSPSDEFKELSETLSYIPISLNMTRTIDPLMDLFAIFKLFCYIKKYKIDVVVGHTPKGGMIAMIASFFAGVENRIYFRHGIFYETSFGVKKLLLKSIDRLTGSLAVKVVCVSNDVKCKSEIDKLNDTKKNIILGRGTCNGVDTKKRFNKQNISVDLIEELRCKYFILEDDIVIGYVGRIVKDKGIEDLIEAWRIIITKYKNVKLLLVGPFEDKDSVSSKCKKIIEEEESIIYTGFVSDSENYFALMDIFILPTYREGFPTVTLEASSMQIPVISSKATGCKESLIENVTGIFCENDANDIAKKMEYYIINPVERKQAGIDGRKFVSKNFDHSIIWELLNSKLGI
ncbi:glycosyltransferase family 4 protein [Flavobacterium columnare]|uniref:Glycosyltransferase family 1 protein n=1 Tax=Flavobacterium columnare TaxID=996 RepID=A0AA94F4P0_9FLAO|nr:glycosyltransferase family 4 protein [Flavobacterium columnare]MCH4829050.1 glycosyltransferase family 4 protein [Flavobacterium columnare]MCH4833826.1 glycosyltransferase family 4 protein [Flavobacterium columnare]